MFLSAAVLTTATACLLVSVVSCCTDCKRYRMRLVTGTRRHECMSPVLCSLHWLPVSQRITYKTAVITYKCLHDLAPRYLSAYCTPSSDAGRRHLQSTNTGQLIILRTRMNYGDRSFSVHGPCVWNSLPVNLRSADISLDTFRNRLKAFLFNAH